MNKTLVSWIGHTDLRCSQGQEPGLGPIGQAVKERQFAAVELICNTDRSEASAYSKWLQQLTTAPIHIHSAALSSPMHFGEVYEAADRIVASVLKDGAKSLVFHLSPGTSAMTAMWLVLATTKYPAELIASSKETGVYTPEFPFEIAADYVPRKRAAAKGDLVQAAFDERTPPAFDGIIHRCEAMRKVIARAQKVAQFDVPVMLLGETGTGKELFAKAIHYASPRSGGPFIAVNCGAIPRELVEAELFGYIRGAFTGATSSRTGLIEQADRGTLFLDELGELPLDIQVKLLRVLQSGEVRRVGDDKVTRVDFRVISATHRNLEKAVVQFQFREDLYYRLAVGILTLPPLRQRPGDLTPLIEFRLNQLQQAFSQDRETQLPRLSAGARSVLNQHPWTGNIRELFNALTRAVIWSEGPVIDKQEMEQAISRFSSESVKCSILDRPLTDGFSLEKVLAEVESQFIRRALKDTSSRAAAARRLGLESGQALKYRMDVLKISDAD